MDTREWLMSERNLIDGPLVGFEDVTDGERANLMLLVEQCRGWSNGDIDMWSP